MQNEEPAMRRAFSLARASLDDFLAKVKAPPKGTSSYAVKVGVREGKNTEYFWMNELKFGDGKYAARVNNEPRLVTSVEYGEIYHFSKSQIVDWMYIDKANKKMMGNFTACALLTKEPKEQAEEFKKQYGLTCE
ncbi:MAG: DUF2314 domain-containing protein [Burkholderiales bacterium]|nr:DUF2314 domain-containing protein [Burkholderiales bacterium]